jgi:hypothetical protein
MAEYTASYSTSNGMFVGFTGTNSQSFVGANSAAFSNYTAVEQRKGEMSVSGCSSDKTTNPDDVYLFNRNGRVTSFSSSAVGDSVAAYPASVINIGSRNNGAASPLDGDLVEMIGYARALTIPEGEAVSRSLNQKNLTGWM